MAAGLTIETQGLTKRFGRQLAVDNVDLAVPHGAVFGFLGPNGSGKTTTIRMLLGLAAASAGTVSVLGMPMPHGCRRCCRGWVRWWRGRRFIPFCPAPPTCTGSTPRAGMRTPGTRNARVAAALERVGLCARRRQAGARLFAGHEAAAGDRQRAAVPRELLVLDEPTNGLDPQGTREVRSLVRSLAADGATVFVSSHLLAEVEQICTHAAIMSAGRLVAQGPLEELRRGGEMRIRLLTPDAGTACEVLLRLGMTPERGDGVHGEAVHGERRRQAGSGHRRGAACGCAGLAGNAHQPQSRICPSRKTSLPGLWRQGCGSAAFRLSGKALRSVLLP